MPNKANRPNMQAGRRDPLVTLNELDETVDMDIDLNATQGEAGKLAQEIRETAAKVKKMGAMNAMQQMQHAPNLIADAMAQMAYALELIELSDHG